MRGHPDRARTHARAPLRLAGIVRSDQALKKGIRVRRRRAPGLLAAATGHGVALLCGCEALSAPPLRQPPQTAVPVDALAGGRVPSLGADEVARRHGCAWIHTVLAGSKAAWPHRSRARRHCTALRACAGSDAACRRRGSACSVPCRTRRPIPASAAPGALRQGHGRHNALRPTVRSRLARLRGRGPCRAPSRRSDERATRRRGVDLPRRPAPGLERARNGGGNERAPGRRPPPPKTHSERVSYIVFKCTIRIVHLKTIYDRLCVGVLYRKLR